MKYKVTIEGQTFEVEVGDLRARPIEAWVGGEKVEVWPESRSIPAPHPARPVRPAAPTAAPPSASPLRTRLVRAPLPGVVVAVSVQPGDEVTAGQELCVLEAMKMKNPLRATHSGKIAEVKVAVGQAVKHHEELMIYAED